MDSWTCGTGTYFIRAFEEKYGRKKEQRDDDMDVLVFRREAIISVGGFIAT